MDASSLVSSGMILNTDSFFSSVNSAPVDVFQDAGSVKNDMALLDWASFSGATDRQIRWDAILTFTPAPHAQALRRQRLPRGRRRRQVRQLQQPA
ncbi:hypothetical protein PF002_g18376 [Phytophthora fragariae]|uniref:Uncharacterized protein n=2 Tax=Phytophthora fragariae TaxID=53985 RepID=A0A6A4CJK3_9STRA|nr:hypothetical protein PF003_g17573 [Phytophthora fragariae]KAE9089454.1 hypothetical protein PF007_g19588 [Phytophthora fragariae]KAE9211969.1 hypothetical protein PF002_g18376 [Phytophthora fragariae]KAE9292477.1 hypothetical protein PF001_g18699 [Phytophthora fragariae]